MKMPARPAIEAPAWPRFDTAAPEEAATADADAEALEAACEADREAIELLVCAGATIMHHATKWQDIHILKTQRPCQKGTPGGPQGVVQVMKELLLSSRVSRESE